MENERVSQIVGFESDILSELGQMAVKIAVCRI